MKKINSLFFALGVFLILFGCTSNTINSDPPKTLKIAISKAVPQKAYQNYINWIKFADSTVQYYDMYHLDFDSALALLKSCDGLILTGGTDIFPGRYGKEEDTARCWTSDFKRDTMEVNLLRSALKQGMPVVGICRGLQMINVELGGKLYIDLPTDLDTTVKHQATESYNAKHEVKIKESSLLHEISGTLSGITNSNHHQGIEVLAPPLEAIAFTSDGLTESIQLKEKGSQFLLGVQWHPERMDYNSSLSGKLAIRFMKEAKNYNKQTKK